MPSPFPGMDPYLEHPGLWPDVHHRLITITGDLLTERLKPKYYARIEERVYVSDEEDPGRSVIVPDLRVAERPNTESHARPPIDVTDAGGAVAEPLVVTTLIEEEIHEARLEIIDRAERSVVAVIEILSPANKVPNSRGRGSYAQKRQEVMHSPSHLIEIDLLRTGARFAPQEALPPHDYYIHVSRAEKRPKALAWPVRLDQKLPTIPVPLRGDDPDFPLDLQRVLDTAYDRAAYELEIDYAREPIPPLSSAHAQWAEGLLRARGLR